MEKETGEIKSKDETGFSEKQLDVNVEIGIFKKPSQKQNQSRGKVIFQKKAKK